MLIRCDFLKFDKIKSKFQIYNLKYNNVLIVISKRRNRVYELKRNLCILKLHPMSMMTWTSSWGYICNEFTQHTRLSLLTFIKFHIFLRYIYSSDCLISSTMKKTNKLKNLLFLVAMCIIRMHFFIYYA